MKFHRIRQTSLVCLGLGVSILGYRGSAFVPCKPLIRTASVSFATIRNRQLRTSLPSIFRANLEASPDPEEKKRQRLWNALSEASLNAKQRIRNRIWNPLRKTSEEIKETYANTNSNLLKAFPKRSRRTITLQLGASLVAIFMTTLVFRPSKAFAMAGGMGGSKASLEPMSQ